MPRVSAEVRRAELVEAARELLVREGPSALTARRIAAEADAPLSAINYAFRSMDELLAVVSRDVVQRGIASMGPFTTQVGVRGAIEDLLLRYARWVQEAQKPATAFFEIYVGTLRSGQTNETVEFVRAEIIGILEEAQRFDPETPRVPLPQLASLVMMAAEGLTLLHLGRADKHRTNADVAHLIAAIQSLV
jgi:AcrR family transcriptional regulator